MDNWLALFDGQTRYTLEINDSPVTPDVLRFQSREALSETDLEFIQRILSEVGIFWRTEMDEARGLEVVIFADSQLNYRFDVRLPYREPSGLYDGAAESVWDVYTLNKVVPGTGLLQEWLTTVDGKVWSFRQRGFIC